MILDRVTITGADNNVDQEELRKLSKKYPFVEWGILLSGSKMGTPRYPTMNWVENSLMLNLNLSAHLCGQKYANPVLEKLDLTEVYRLAPLFKRYQLNYSFAYGDKHDLYGLLIKADSNSHISFILQYNQANAPALDWLRHHFIIPKNVHFLYDSSGGNGIPSSLIKAPFTTYTGYAGGLNPSNVQSRIESLINYKVSKFDFTSRKVWIDMESGVRTDNKFDLKKVEQVLKICSKYIHYGVSKI